MCKQVSCNYALYFLNETPPLVFTENYLTIDFVENVYVSLN